MLRYTEPDQAHTWKWWRSVSQSETGRHRDASDLPAHHSLPFASAAVVVRWPARARERIGRAVDVLLLEAPGDWPPLQRAALVLARVWDC
ncbi:hypothetical protein [Streptomyces sp. BRA346]|uniref:hypothetical protein n=1 Tax=Streptomyces sp. BRA346 TaxID=2878199 RepID=UPI004063DA97